MRLKARILATALNDNAARRGDTIAMSDDHNVMTWADVLERTVQVAEMLPVGAIGIFGSNSCNWSITYLACILTGRTVVPLPEFFSAEQREHILTAAKVTSIIAVADYPDPESSVPVIAFGALAPNTASAARAPQRLELLLDTQPPAENTLIVFTSGSTGRPKGVRLTLINIMSTAEALKAAVRVTESDRYLSVMPLAMLLEQICAILIPVLCGARVEFCRTISDRAITGARVNLAEKVAATKPSIMVLVPQLLQILTEQVTSRDDRCSFDSLRFIAVGGASSGAWALQAARDAGLPAFEGYGLTECSSVVALNTPAGDSLGSVGQPLAGVHIDIVDGEIVVSGPNVMAGYLGGSDLRTKRWATGDVGAIAANGTLLIQGRKDNLIVCPNGRNVSPEWVEGVIQSTSGAHAIVCPADTPNGLAVVLVGNWLGGSEAEQAKQLLSKVARTLPEYASPSRFRCLSTADSASLGLFRMGKPNRRLAQSLLQQTSTPTDKVPHHEPV